MTRGTQAAPLFFRDEWAIAFGVAALAQLSFLAMMASRTPPAVRADISNDQALPMAVAVTPVLNGPLLKQGVKNPTKLPDAWQRAKPRPKTEAPLPSRQAPQTPDAIPKTKSSVIDAGPPPLEDHDAGEAPTLVSDKTASDQPTSSELGDPNGVKGGTETDPLKARAVNMYRAQLVAWFLSRFNIRGKIPFSDLRRLHAAVNISINDERRVSGFVIVEPSGDMIFDAEVRSTLQTIKSNDIELPAPPPMYPDVLGSSLPVRFQCTVESQCE